MSLFRAFAYHPAQAVEVMVFFQCRINERPSEALLARLALIWGVTPESIDAYNIWSEDELRRLFEVGSQNGEAIYEDSLPLLLVSPEMHKLLHAIWQKLPQQKVAT